MNVCPINYDEKLNSSVYCGMWEESELVSKQMEKSTAVVFLDVRKIDIVDKEKDAWMKAIVLYGISIRNRNCLPLMASRSN